MIMYVINHMWCSQLWKQHKDKLRTREFKQLDFSHSKKSRNVLFKREVRRKSVRFHGKKKSFWQIENHCKYERVLYLEVLDNHFGKDHGLDVKVRVLLLKQHLSKEKMLTYNLKVNLNSTVKGELKTHWAIFVLTYFKHNFSPLSSS